VAKLKTTDLKLFKFFLTFVKPYKGWVWLALLAMPFAIGSTLAMPWLIVKVIDEKLSHHDLTGFWGLIGLMALSVLVGYFADGVYTYSLQRTGQKSIADLRIAVFRHCLALPRSFYDHNPVGKVLSRLTSDMEALGESLAMGVLNLISDFVKTLGLFFFLLYLSWKLTLVVVVILLPVWGVTVVLKKKLRQTFNEAREALAEATAYLAECLIGIKTVQLFAAEEKVLTQFNRKNFRFLQAQNRNNTYDALLYSLIEGLTSVAMAALIWYGAGLILVGVVSIGVLVGFINTLNRIFVPIREFAQQLAMIQRAFSALEQVMVLLSEPLPQENRLSEAQERQLGGFESLVFDQVSFGYGKAGELALKKVSFSLEKGQRVALVGATGSGKSTILRLIYKAYEGYQGSIRLNGIELSTIPRSKMLALTSLMQQDVYLFNEPVGFNIALGLELSPEAIREAAQAVNADPFIEALPGGYDFKITDNGKNLSSGQAQLVSFARSMAKPADLVLLDEATSSVDSITEEAIQKATTRIFETKTVIAIAHRLSTIEHSDLILVMKGGEIIERGTHPELLAQRGYYEQLLNHLTQEQPLEEAKALGS